MYLHSWFFILFISIFSSLHLLISFSFEKTVSPYFLLSIFHLAVCLYFGFLIRDKSCDIKLTCLMYFTSWFNPNFSTRFPEQLNRLGLCICLRESDYGEGGQRKGNRDRNWRHTFKVKKFLENLQRGIVKESHQKQLYMKVTD